MAVLKKHSFNEKKLKRYKIGKLIKNNGILNIKEEKLCISYLNAVEKKIIHDFDGSNVLYVRFDPFIGQKARGSI